MHDLHGRVVGPRRIVVLLDTDHLHFCDDVARVHETFRTMQVEPLFAEFVGRMKPIGELAPGAHAHDAVRGLAVAHFDAVLRDTPGAAAMLAGDVAAALAARGIRVTVA